MPHYDFLCSACGFIVLDAQLPIAHRDFPTTQECPQCDSKGTVERMVAAPGVSYTINRGGVKTPETFKDILRNIKSKHRGSTINVD